MNIPFRYGNSATLPSGRSHCPIWSPKSSNGKLRKLMVPFQFPNCTITFFVKPWVSYAWLFTDFNLLSSLLSFKPILATSRIEIKLWLSYCPLKPPLSTYSHHDIQQTLISLCLNYIQKLKRANSRRGLRLIVCEEFAFFSTLAWEGLDFLFGLQPFFLEGLDSPFLLDCYYWFFSLWVVVKKELSFR